MVSYPRRNDYEDVDACAGFGGSCADSWRDDGVDYDERVIIRDTLGIVLKEHMYNNILRYYHDSRRHGLGVL